MEVVSCLVMGANAYYYLMPLGMHPSVSRLWILRPSRVERGEIPGAEYVLVAQRPTLWRLAQMLWASLRLGWRKEVKAFISINPFPYGLVQLPAAVLYHKPIHFGFVGSDWYRHVRGRSGWLLRPFIRRADFVTATGPLMRRQMIDYGIKEERIAILPHAIDVDNYPINDPETAKYTCIFVGQLIQRKRVDLILQAFALVLEVNASARLCIAGDGPLAEDLVALASELGIERSVDFVGFQDDVRPYIRSSKMLVIASDMEGLPFAIIEGMSSGLVPVSTPVGTIEDLIVDDENGLFFFPGDAEGLADCICRLMDEPDLYNRLRANVLQLRDDYAFAAATTVWDGWLSGLDTKS
jgi:glycosyltransferase involved in cell wall biosynthesis